MARQKDQSADVEVVETEEVENTPEASGEKAATAKAKAEPKRGTLPEGYVTPVGLAKELSKRGLQKNRDGVVLETVAPQMVYSYIKNAPMDDSFPIETVKDSIDADRQACKLETALEWWERKNKRTSERSTNAAEKAAKKAEAAAKKAAEPVVEAEGEGAEETVIEAE